MMNWGRTQRFAAAMAVGALVTMAGGAASAALFTAPELPAGRGTDTPDLSVGRATGSVRLADVEFRALPVRGTQAGKLGMLTTTASTVERQLSLLTVTGLEAGSDKIVNFTRESTGAPNGKERSTDGPQKAKDAGINSHLALGGWYLEAPARETAVARLGVLEGQLFSDRMGVKGSIGERGLFSEIDTDGAVARAAVTVEGFSIDLAALLPIDMRLLPFGVSLAMAEHYVAGMDERLRNGVDHFRSVLERLDAADRIVAELDEAKAEVDQLVAGHPDLALLGDAIDTAKAILAAAKSDLASAEDALAAAGATLAQAIADLEAPTIALNAAVHDLQSAAAAVAAIEAEIAQLQAEIADLEAQILADPTLLLTLQPQIEQRLDRITDLEDELTIARAVEDDAAAVVATAQATLAPFTTAKNVAQSAKDAAQSAVASLSSAVSSALSQLATARAAYDAAIAALATADGAVKDAHDRATMQMAKLSVLFIELQALLADVPDLMDFQLSLLDLLEATPVIEVAGVELVTEARADASGGSTVVECAITGLKVLGKPLPVPDCDDVDALWLQAEQEIRAFLSTIAGYPVDGVVVRGPRKVVETADGPDAQGWTWGRATFSPLRVMLPTISMGRMVDETHTRVGEIIAGILGHPDLQTVPELVAAPTVPASGDRDLTSAVPLPVGTMGVQHYRIASGGPLSDQLEQLEEEVNQTPAGQAPQGETVGFDAELGEVAAETFFRAAENAGGPTGGNPTPVPGGPDGPDGSIGDTLPGDATGNGAEGAGSGEGHDGSGGVGDGDGQSPAGPDLPQTGAAGGLAGLMLLGAAAGARGLYRGRRP